MVCRLSSIFPLLFFPILILTACSIPGPAPAPTHLPTPTPAPSNTPFPIPDLTPILSGRGILPARATAVEFNDTPHPDFKDMPSPADFTSLVFSAGSKFMGRVSIFLYASFEELDSAWPVVLETVKTPKEISGPGELAAVNFSDIVFIRCSALVHIKIVGTQTDELRLYAAMLDARLEPAVCR